MDIDGKRLAEVLGLAEPLPVHSELCRSQISAFEDGLKSGAALHVACTQEAPLFREVAADKGGGEADLAFTNIRERAGWCTSKGSALPKMAALLAEAAHRPEPTGMTTLKSGGVCLVYGRGQAALDVAAELSDRLSVTVLLSDPEEALPPGIVSVPIYKGRIRKAVGHLGAFEVEVDGYAPMLPSSKGALEFVMPRDGAHSTCDIVFDMSGGTPLFADAQRRDGYLHVDPSHPAAVARAMFKVTDLVGEFEKPLYVSYDAGILKREGGTGFESISETPEWELFGSFGPKPGDITVCQLAAYSSPTSTIAIWSPTTKVFTPLSVPRGRHLTPTWSADGRYLAYSSDALGNRDLWVYDEETGRALRVTRVESRSDAGI
jgi:hypothetical protein